ncbi:MAG: SIS domain-containing protein [bacterium]|nr:SIS domain-containing protein [bacterium]
MDEQRYLRELIERYPKLAAIQEDIQRAYELLRDCYAAGNKLLVAGNGGSCADAEHIVGELMKGFVKKRTLPQEFQEKLCAVDADLGAELAQKLQGALPSLSLTGHAGLTTAFLNDVDGTLSFAQQLYGLGQAGDVFLGISTSGNSKNVLYAACAAKAKGMKVVGLLGRDGGALRGCCDVALVVPETETFKIQELHLPVYHALCLMLEEHFFKD